MPRFKAQHYTFFKSGVDKFLGALRKSQINYLQKLQINYSKVEKSRGQTMAQNTGKADFFHYFNSFNKNCGWRGGLLYFIGKLCKYVSRI